MSASAEQSVQSALHEARGRRIDLTAAIRRERTATVGFMDEAVDAGWSWDMIGQRLGITGTAARRYYNRNRRKVRDGVT